MIKKLKNQPYTPKWEQEEEKKTICVLVEEIQKKLNRPLSRGCKTNYNHKRTYVNWICGIAEMIWKGGNKSELHWGIKSRLKSEDVVMTCIYEKARFGGTCRFHLRGRKLSQARIQTAD
jgi:hypothetical protein